MNNAKYQSTIKKTRIKTVFIAVAVIAFFVTIILSFYVFMYSAVKDNIRMKGEKFALEAADNFDRYFTMSSNLIKLEKEMFDQMLLDGATEEQLQNYIVQETQRIQSSIDKDYSGLYGLISGVYHDGANWVPDDDFVPTERPWYIEAMSHPGEMVIIKPYVDAQTDEIITTLAITLIDKKSVIALDISFDMIKTMTAQESESGGSPIQVIIDDRGNVLAHSMTEEIGKNYSSDDGSMGYVISQKLRTAEGEQSGVEVFYDGTRYMVYSILLSNGWRSISIIDATESYSPLYNMVIAMLVVLVVVVLILTLMFVNQSAKTAKADMLNHQLATTADIYMSVYDIDIINNVASEIKSSSAPVVNAEEESEKGAQEIFFGIMNNIPDSSSKQHMFDFVDFSTLDERLAETDAVTTEFLSFGYRWCRARFLVSERTPEGKLSHVLWLVENIDSEKRSRDKLIDISERAVAASEAKSAFLSNMSHEIRTPINAMLGLNEMVLRECDDQDILSYSAGINTAGHTLLGIVNDILDFSKIEAGKLETIPTEYNLSSMLNDLVTMVHTRADDKGLAIKVEVDSSIPEKLFGDEIRIKQVITNILTNAVKYTEKGTVTFTVGYERLFPGSDEIKLIVAVKDTGIGIKKEDMSKLFSEFDRIEEERNRNIEGTGLGMAITQSLLTMMGSSLKVESEYGKGSTFSFEVKQTVIDWKEIGNYESTFKKNAVKQSSYKALFIAPEAEILVVDDTPLNLTVFKSLLKKTKVKIDAVDSGDKSIRACCTKVYDIVFMDHMMPEKDGIQTLKELKGRNDNLNKSTPFVCLTANAISGAKEKYIEAGFNDYLTKPIDSARLEEMLKEYLPGEKVFEAPEDTAVSESGDVIPDFVYDLKELDVKSAVEKCGSQAMYMDILSAFAEMMADCVADAKSFLARGEIRDAGIKIHAVKSELRTIGAYELGNLAQSLETAAEKGDVKYLDEKKDELFERSLALADKFAVLKKNDFFDDDSLPLMPEDELIKLLKGIGERAEDFDDSGVDELMEQLKGHSFPKAYKDKVRSLYHLVDNMDYDQIPELLDMLK